MVQHPKNDASDHTRSIKQPIRPYKIHITTHRTIEHPKSDPSSITKTIRGATYLEFCLTGNPFLSSELEKLFTSQGKGRGDLAIIPLIHPVHILALFTSRPPTSYPTNQCFAWPRQNTPPSNIHHKNPSTN